MKIAVSFMVAVAVEIVSHYISIFAKRIWMKAAPLAGAASRTSYGICNREAILLCAAFHSSSNG